MKKRTMPGAKSTPAPKGPNNEPLCRWCLGSVAPPRSTFCSNECVHEWRLRTNGSYLRKYIFKRDRGICAKCGIDTRKITKGFRRPLKGETKQQWKNRVSSIRRKYKIPKRRKTAWDLDHIKPIWNDGKVFDFNNMQTLCLKCHKSKSSKETTKRAIIKKENKD